MSEGKREALETRVKRRSRAREYFLHQSVAFDGLIEGMRKLRRRETPPNGAEYDVRQSKPERDVGTEGGEEG